MTIGQSKPYEIRARVFAFACEIIRAFPRGQLDPASLKVWSQLIAAATSVGAHLEEAKAAGTRVHFLSLTRGALREMRESHYWIRLLVATQLHGFEKAQDLVKESDELVAILATIVRNTHENGHKSRSG